MHLIRVHRTFTKLKSFSLRHYSNAAVAENDYTETPEYPPLLDISLHGRKLRERQELHEKIKNISTIEEKQIALNMPKYYGWRCVMLKEDKVPYNAMPFVQTYTRSHFREVDKLPEVYLDTKALADSVVAEIKDQIADAIAIENEGVNYIQTSLLIDKPEKQQLENIVSNRIVRQINRIVTNALADKVSHILSTQVDYNPRHEAFWFVGGLTPCHQIVNWRKKVKWLKDRAEESIDRPVQYVGTPFVALRNSLPLKPVIPYSEAENPEFKVLKYDFGPESVGYFRELRHGTNIPGYWPGEYDEFGLLSIHGRGHILDRKESFGEEDNIEALHCQAMKSSFGWLLAQANYQGFTTFNDITYPLVTQTIITNGQLWSFYVYQLNTITMHNDVMDTNPKHNICFGMKPQKLYDIIENGQVKGLNEETLATLIQLHINAPEERDYEMKPYLGKNEQLVADYEDDKKRVWLEDRFKTLMSNRPRHNLLPEIYMWEKIYKIKFQTRFFERKARFFELGVDPFKRRLDEHLPKYIPKVLRPYPKAKKKFETTYYPKV